MIENSFIHLPGIGAQTEQRLWSLGCHCWDEFEQQLPELFNRTRAETLLRALDESRAALEGGEFGFFNEKMKSSERWRLLPRFISENRKIAYLDIETTGLGFPPMSESTSIAVYMDGHLYVEYKERKKCELLTQVDEEADCLVTFNGLTFDLPFLRREFDGLQFSQPHVDLRYWFAHLGYRGGLKKIQMAFPEIPQRTAMDIDGFDAVRLWTMHDRGVENALETLMTYNAEDTVVLEQLVFTGLNLEAERKANLRLETYRLPLPPRVETRICPEVYRMLRR